jgi:hypothetical protein
LLFAGGGRLSDRWSVELGYLHLFRHDGPWYSRRSVEGGGRLHLTTSYYYNVDPRGVILPYWALRIDHLRAEYNYTYQENPLRNAFHFGTSGLFPSAAIRSRATTVNAMMGVQLWLLPHFGLDLQFGGGLRYVDSRWRQPATIPEHVQPARIGTYWTVNVPLDLRLLFRL